MMEKRKVTNDIIVNAYGYRYESLKNHINENGWFPDEVIGQNESLSVWVLSYCEREYFGTQLYWRPSTIRTALPTEPVPIENVSLINEANNSVSELRLSEGETINIIELEARRLKWSKATFKDANALTSLIKLRNEIDEVEENLTQIGSRQNLVEEYADCLMCLFDSSGRAAVHPEEIFEAFAKKLEVNMSCEWVHNGNGTYSRIKQKQNG